MKKLDDTEIKTFLETAPLYQWSKYERPSFITQGCLQIDAIDSLCGICGSVRPFHSKNPGVKVPIGSIRSNQIQEFVPQLESGITHYIFICVTCKKEQRIFHVEQKLTEKTISLQKYGELPRQKLLRDKELQEFFSDDSDYYEKAVVCMSNAYGIAAFAYYRRIIENNISSLLDLLSETSVDDPNSEEILTALAELKNNSPMSDKIKVANNALPAYLKHHGINPLGTLYKILSDGVHSLSDTECLQRAQKIDVCIKYLISELSSRKRNLSKFKGMIKSITG
ncbi:MAG: hypothetical protein JXR40_13145 [Pontiellaceae bacterium]|nr:hypothetical protein [Pontiellaceae bacterium]